RKDSDNFKAHATLDQGILSCGSLYPWPWRRQGTISCRQEFVQALPGRLVRQLRQGQHPRNALSQPDGSQQRPQEDSRGHRR
ncbi:unnamed protein product, partial [Ectocarpus sp. 12 AP-2014]